MTNGTGRCGPHRNPDRVERCGRPGNGGCRLAAAWPVARRGVRCALLALTVGAALSYPRSAAAQGAGSTGATVLQMLAGSRATAFSGAYTAAARDADVLFYNPAGIAGLGAAAGVSYQRHVEDIGLASAAGVLRLGRFVLGASAIFLDYGEIDELVPDPSFGNQTGLRTGRTVGASETAARLSGAMPFADGRVNVGASLGWISMDLAGLGRSAPFLDVGAQYGLSGVTLGAVLRNVGGAIGGGGLADADMPTEARLGAMAEWLRPTGVGVVASADLVAELNGGTTGLVAGIEAGLLPGGASRIGAVGRVGFNAGAGEEGQGRLLLGGGISVGPVAVDYAYQSYDLFGPVHRIGVRWVRPD